jgi:hypothetical protein
MVRMPDYMECNLRRNKILTGSEGPVEYAILSKRVTGTEDRRKRMHCVLTGTGAIRKGTKRMLTDGTGGV